MKIVLLGASSRIGMELAAAFSSGNHLVLIGRDLRRLQQAVERCNASGAVRVDVISPDSSGWDGISAAVTELVPIDLLINAVSATSRLRDDQIDADKIPSYVEADLLGPIRIVENILATQLNPLHVVFVSTVLTLVKSPNRTIYSSLKLLQESSLARMQERNRRLNVFVVRVGKVIAPESDSDEAGKLSAATFRAYHEGKKDILYGASGFGMVTLFYLQPILFLLITRLQRNIRKLIDSRRGVT